jgi:hypothetical protein
MRMVSIGRWRYEIRKPFDREGGPGTGATT